MDYLMKLYTYQRTNEEVASDRRTWYFNALLRLTLYQMTPPFHGLHLKAKIKENRPEHGPPRPSFGIHAFHCLYQRDASKFYSTEYYQPEVSIPQAMDQAAYEIMTAFLKMTEADISAIMQHWRQIGPDIIMTPQTKLQRKLDAMNCRNCALSQKITNTERYNPILGNTIYEDHLEMIEEIKKEAAQ